MNEFAKRSTFKRNKGAAMTTLVLENKTLKLEFNKENGALTRFSSKLTGWKILDRPERGLSFKLMVPVPGQRNNLVLGEKQALTKVTVNKSRKEATFVWDGLTSEKGGALDIQVEIQVKLIGDAAVYYSRITNRTDLVVENVYVPCIGDVQRPKGSDSLRVLTNGYAGPNDCSLFPKFINNKGYFGVDHPSLWMGQNPQQPFLVVDGKEEGFCAWTYDTKGEIVGWHFELFPGYDESMIAHVPTTAKIGSKDVFTVFDAAHVPFILAGETRDLTPIALQCYQGTWHHGVDIYKAWEKKVLPLPKLPKWLDEPHAWLQIHINSPEDELRIQFKDLPQVAAECARHGVKAIQLVGWNDGGQDQGNPSHNPDPRLGTWDELKDAIAQIQAMGVKLILFSKFVWADQGTEWFKKELHHLASHDPYGNYHVYGGYQYQTASQLLDINTKRLIPMCFQSDKWFDICAKEFKKLVDLGADGMLYDESFHHSPSKMCFHPKHGHRYGASSYARDNDFIRHLGKFVGKKKDFMMGGEANYPYQYGVYHVSYHRTEDAGHIPMSRFIHPESRVMTAVTGFNDRNMINQCLIYNYVVSYEPYNFKGRLDDFPNTIAYGKQMDTLRAELADYFWYGEFRHTVGVKVTCKGKDHPSYGVFINRKTGKLGVAMANYDLKKAVTVKAVPEKGRKLAKYRIVGETEWKPIRSGITIPARGAVVVI